MGLKSSDACLAKAKDDEPIFVLRAQDKLAPALVRMWANLAEVHGCGTMKLNEAELLADRMEAWAGTNGSKWPD